MTNNAELDERQQKASIAATSRLVKKGAAWLVPSQSLPTSSTPSS
ncbi:MAG: hypothetical protein U0802_22330 [Candidatus Binatia bacterium]